MNHVELDKAAGIIRNNYRGDQNYQTVMAVGEQTIELAEQLKQDQRPVLILVDVTQIGRTGGGTQQASREIFTRLKYDRIAVFGGNAYMAATLKAVTAVLKLGNIRHIKTEPQALKWLNEALVNSG